MNVNPAPMPPPEPDTPQFNATNSLQGVWNRLTAPAAALTDVGEQRAARLAASFLLAITILDFTGGLARIPRVGIIDAFLGPIGYSFVALILAYLLSRTKWYRAAIFFFSLTFSTLAYTTILQQGNQADFGALVLIYVPLSLIVASSFLSGWSVFLLVGLNIGAYVSITLFGVDWPENIGAQAGIITVIGAVLILLTNFRNETEKIRLHESQAINRELEALSQNLENRVETRTQELVAANERTNRQFKQLEAIADLSRSIADAKDISNLLPAITNFISERFGHYHVAIYLNDTLNTFTILRAANSTGGQKMLARGHRLNIGKQGMVGFAISTGQTRIALDVGDDAVYFGNPDLPDTHSEIAIPMQLGSEVIGALDIQSAELNAFSTEDMPVFSTLADQVAISIQNARLLEQTQSALDELERSYTEQTGQIWKGFAKGHSVSGYKFDGVETQPLEKGSGVTAELKAGLTLPMRLRGQIIGKLKLKANEENRKWTQEEIALAEATIERAALALENARLLEDAQRRAAREQAIGEISTKIGTYTDIEAILRSTVNEVGQKIGGARVVFELGSEEEEKQRSKS